MTTESSKKFLSILENAQKTITELKDIEHAPPLLNHTNPKEVYSPRGTSLDKEPARFVKDLEKKKYKNSIKRTLFEFDSDFLTRIGCDKGLSFMRSYNEKLLKEENFLDRVFSIGEIKNICKRYNLLLLPSEDIIVNLLPSTWEIDFLEKCLGKKCDPNNFVVAAPIEASCGMIEKKGDESTKNFALFYFLGDGRYYMVNKWDCGINSKWNYKTNSFVIFILILINFIFSCLIATKLITGSAYEMFIILIGIIFTDVVCFVALHDIKRATYQYIMTSREKGKIISKNRSKTYYHCTE